MRRYGIQVSDFLLLDFSIVRVSSFKNLVELCYLLIPILEVINFYVEKALLHCWSVIVSTWCFSYLEKARVYSMFRCSSSLFAVNTNAWLFKIICWELYPLNPLLLSYRVGIKFPLVHCRFVCKMEFFLVLKSMRKWAIKYHVGQSVYFIFDMVSPKF